MLADCPQTIWGNAVDPKRLRHCVAHECCFGHRRQVAQPRSVRKVRLQLLGEPEREPGLACAAVTGHGDQSVGCDQVEQAAQVPLSAHERSELCGQVAARPENW